MILSPASLNTVVRDNNPAHSVNCGLYLAAGKGELRLESADPNVHPSMDYHYLEEDWDRERLREAVRLCVSLLQHSAYGDIIQDIIAPTPADPRDRRDAGRLAAPLHQHLLPHFGHLQDGHDRRPHGRRRSALARSRRLQPPHSRRIRHARCGPRQHQRHHHDDRRARLRLHQVGELTRYLRHHPLPLRGRARVGVKRSCRGAPLESNATGRPGLTGKARRMATIEGIRIQNYRVLKDVTLGRLWNTPNVVPLTPMTAVIGKNGVGKSSLFDAFGFLADCLKLGVEEACDVRGRGGFDRIRSQGCSEPIMFQVCYRGYPQAPLIAFSLAIAKDDTDRPYIHSEILAQLGGTESDNVFRGFLILARGVGVVWRGESQGQEINKDADGGFDFLSVVTLIARMAEITRGSDITEIIEALEAADQDSELPGILEEMRAEVAESVVLQDNRRLGIASLGALAQYPRIAALREFVEGWYLSYFTPDAARSLPMVGPQRHLSIHGDNLANVVQYMQREYPNEFEGILRRIAGRVPGIDGIDTKRSEDSRLLLRFNERGFEDPFYAQQMSDGTLKALSPTCC